MASLVSQRDATGGSTNDSAAQPGAIAAATPSNIPASFPPHIATLLAALHSESLTQEHAINSTRLSSIRSLLKSSSDHDRTTAVAQVDELMLDKFIALDQDKCLFIYDTLLAMRAKIVVEAGTSFGVSTIYLALAANKAGGKGRVVATEKETPKADKARQIWRQCGKEVDGTIDLRIGDLEETLKTDLVGDGEFVDALLLDIWPYVALPALKLVQPRMRPGSVVFVDNTISSKEGYKELLAVLRDPNGPWRTLTLPYSGGLEMSVYDP